MMILRDLLSHNLCILVLSLVAKAIDTVSDLLMVETRAAANNSHAVSCLMLVLICSPTPLRSIACYRHWFVDKDNVYKALMLEDTRPGARAWSFSVNHVISSTTNGGPWVAVALRSSLGCGHR